MWLWGMPQGRLDICTIKENRVKVNFFGHLLRLAVMRDRETENGVLLGSTTG